MWEHFRPRVPACLVALIGTLALSDRGAAQWREDVVFQISQPVAAGQGVFLLGDQPELGGGVLIKSVRLGLVSGSMFRVTVSLPVNRTYSYQYYVRAYTPPAPCNAANGTAIGAPTPGATSTVPLTPPHKTIFYHSTIYPPVLHWRQDSGAFQTLSMHPMGPGRTSGEVRWGAAGFGESHRNWEFYLTDAAQTVRDPVVGTYSTPLDGAFLQDGHLFTYVPAPSVSAHRRDYNPAAPPTIVSTNLYGEARPYRVMLPRGYDEHPTRRYPVLYLHDGQVAFEPDPIVFFTPPPNVVWPALDANGDAIANLVRSGQVREAIIVGVDPMSWLSRFRDMVPPGDTAAYPGAAPGAADKYVAFILSELKPVIDAAYRTLPEPGSTATAGLSLGGLVSLYMGWDFPGSFPRIGSWSGSMFLPNFMARVFTEPKRPIRIYLDSGEDNAVPNANLRDNLIRKSPEPYAVEGDLRYTYACGQQHFTPDFATRLPGLLTFLLPATEATSELPGACYADCSGDGALTVADFGCFQTRFVLQNPYADCNADGSLTIADFGCFQTKFVAGCP